jgi:hypothetical protein
MCGLHSENLGTERTLSYITPSFTNLQGRKSYFYFKEEMRSGIMAHIYNPGCSGGRDQEDHGRRIRSRLAQA